MNHWFGPYRTRFPIVPLREHAELGTGHTPSRNVEAYWKDCTIPWVTVEDIRANGVESLDPLARTRQFISELGMANSAAVLHPEGTVMLSRTASIGFSCIIGRPMATTQAFVTWTPRGSSLDGRFLLLALRAQREYFDSIAYGATHLTIYFPDIKKLRIPLPPPTEQRRIVDYIRHEAAKIDALIEKQQQLIALLDEKCQTVINHAITKGLNTDVPMRESGGRHLGAVPDHWKLTRVKRVGWYRGGAGFPDHEQGKTDLELPFYKVGDLGRVESGELGPPAHTITRETARRLGATVFPASTIVFAKVGAALLLRRFRTLPAPSCIDNNMMGWVIDETRMDRRYALFVAGLLPLDLIVHPGAVPSINGGSLGQELVPVPPMSEQRKIVNLVDRELQAMQGVAISASKVIKLLEERRKSLISGAVTGTIDVRDWHAPESSSPVAEVTVA